MSATTRSARREGACVAFAAVGCSICLLQLLRLVFYDFDIQIIARGAGGGSSYPPSYSRRDGMGASLSIDRLVPADFKDLCPDRLGVFPGETLEELIANWSNRTADLKPELQALRKRSYFIAALQRDVGEIFGAWQRELFKVVYLLGDATLSNVFVSLYESHSSDVTQLELVGADMLLDTLGVPHKVLLGHEATYVPDRDSMSRIAYLALLRNVALQPLFESPKDYDVVLYLNDILYCATDVVDLARVVTPGGSAAGGGIDADMSCAVDFLARTPGQEQQDEVRIYDTWVVHDMMGMNFRNDRPYACQDEAQVAFDALQPFEVFSCWNGMVAVDGDLFQKARVRFRAAHRYECELSECELIGRDLRALNRGRIVMVPTARTAYDWDVFRTVAKLPNPGLPEPLRLPTAEPQLEPAGAMCCGLDRRNNIVLVENCFMQRDWRLAYDLFGVPVAPSRGALEAAFDAPADDNGGFTAATAAAAALLLKGVSESASLLSLRIPRHMVHWGADAERWADDAQTVMRLSRLSHGGVNADFEHVTVSDAALEDWRAGRANDWGRDLAHAFQNAHVRQGFMRLEYMQVHGGVFVPPGSQAGQPFTDILAATDEMVVGVAGNAATGERHLLFVAAVEASPVLADMLAHAAASLRAPRPTYERLWAAAEGGDSRPPEELEHQFFTGVEMMLEVIRAQHSVTPGVRVLHYDLADVMFDVARPTQVCDGLKEREALPLSEAAAATLAATGAAQSPVHFDPEVPHNVVFWDWLAQPQRLGVRRNRAIGSLTQGHQLVGGQYLLPTGGEAVLGPVWASESAPACRNGGHCFLWLSPEGVLAVYAGMGLADPAARIAVTVAEPRPDANVSFLWLALQDDGNVVLYGADADTSETVPLWAADSAYPADCRAGSACRVGAQLVLSDTGVVEVRRGVSEAMIAYLEVGMPAVVRLRSCLWSNSLKAVPPLDATLTAAKDGGGTETCAVPKALGLVTYPNSGTSFTLHATVGATGHTVYTVYEAEVNGTHQNNAADQELCGRNACADLGMCQLGKGSDLATTPPPGKGALVKTHVSNYGDGIFCGADGVAAYKKGLRGGAHEHDLEHYAFLRLFRNPFDNLVARFHLLAANDRLVGVRSDKAGFMNDNGHFPIRDIYTFLYWHLNANLVFQDLGLPTALLTYEAIYKDPVGYLRSVVTMLGWTETEVETLRLEQVARAIMGRDYVYFKGEPLPVYIDSFYDAAVVRTIAEIINEVIDHTDCLQKADYIEPRVGPINFVKSDKDVRR